MLNCAAMAVNVSPPLMVYVAMFPQEGKIYGNSAMGERKRGRFAELVLMLVPASKLCVVYRDELKTRRLFLSWAFLLNSEGVLFAKCGEEATKPYQRLTSH